MKLTTNLATRRYVNAARLNALLLAGFVLLGGLLVFNVREAAYNQAELSRLRSMNADAGQRPGEAVSEAQLKALAARIAFANTLIEKKGVNWLTILDFLEEVVPSGVALTQVDPDKQELKLTGAARRFADLRAFLENMEQSKNFSEVYLLNQSEAKVGLTQQGIIFSVTCKVVQR